MKYKAVIFDLDGLLLDSESISLSTFVESCRECDFEPNMEVYYQSIGTNWSKTKEIFLEGYGKNFPYKAITELWLEKYHEEVLGKPVPLKEGALSLLQYLEKEGVKKAVVTSSRKKNALIKLSNAQILSFFDFVLGGDEISKGKPDPEMYLTAAERFNEETAECLAIEDSDNGAVSAFKAGLTVIQVPDLIEPSAKVKALGHEIMESLTEVISMLSSNF